MRFFIAILCILLSACQSGHYSGVVSDHFDGLRFYNPEHQKRKSMLEILQEVIAQQVYLPCATDRSVFRAHAYSDPTHLKVTFVNHSTLLLQSQQINVLTDPVWSDKISPIFISPKRLRPPAIAFDSLPEIDVVLISHNHYDHMDLATLKKLDQKWHPLIMVPLGNKSYLNKKGFTRVVEMDWWDTLRFGKVKIWALPSQHWSARWLYDGYQTLWNSYGLEIQGKKIFFAGDTGLGHFFYNIRARFGTPSLSFLPIGSYTPKTLVHSVHMDPYEAIRAHQILGSRKSYAIHYGAFALGCSSNVIAIEAFKSAKKKIGNVKRFHLMQEGKGYIE